jgi:hypothetical protein
MNNTNTGGPAFATQLECNRDGYAVTGGMTLRDYFAAKAMQALIAAADGDLHHHHGAYDAYAYADAMLKARQA